MGAGATALPIPATNVLTYFTRGLQTGILRGCSSVITSGNPAPTDTYVLCFISAGLTDIASAVLILYTDYITTESPLSWSGVHVIEGSEFVVTACRSTVAVILQTIVDVDISKVP